MNYEAVVDRLITWALERHDVRALVLTGSAASGTEHPLSDRDIEVFASAPAVLLDDESWWKDLGEVLVVERLINGDGDPTRLVYYVGGKLDFTILSNDALRGRRYARPFHVLVDKDGSALTASGPEPHPPPPTPEELVESMHWAWAAALMCGKAIVRDELWAAQLRDRDLKDELLRMVEWDHHVRYGTDVDTKFLGRGLRQWMDDDVCNALEHCWGRFDVDDMRRALLATVNLYVRIAARTQQRLGAPPFDHGKIRCELDKILAFS